jgi:hypothetical protein
MKIPPNKSIYFGVASLAVISVVYHAVVNGPDSPRVILSLVVAIAAMVFAIYEQGEENHD